VPVFFVVCLTCMRVCGEFDGDHVGRASDLAGDVSLNSMTGSNMAALLGVDNAFLCGLLHYERISSCISGLGGSLAPGGARRMRSSTKCMILVAGCHRQRHMFMVAGEEGDEGFTGGIGGGVGDGDGTRAWMAPATAIERKY